MKKLLMAVVCAAMLSGVAEEAEEYEFDRWYAGASATIVLPQGGGRMHRLGGATARIGYYLAEDLALEADAAWLENAAGLGCNGLWHVMGYERLDPFLTFGVCGWIDGQVGPVAGIGSFYHLTDDWSLRADARATLGIDTDAEMVYSLSVGVQYSF